MKLKRSPSSDKTKISTGNKQAEVTQSGQTLNPVPVMLEKNLSCGVARTPSKKSLIPPPQPRKREASKKCLSVPNTVNPAKIEIEDSNTPKADQNMNKSYEQKDRASKAETTIAAVCPGPLYSEPGKTNSYGDLNHMYSEVTGSKPRSQRRAYTELTTMGQATLELRDNQSYGKLDTEGKEPTHEYDYVV